MIKASNSNIFYMNYPYQKMSLDFCYFPTLCGRLQKSLEKLIVPENY